MRRLSPVAQLFQMPRPNARKGVGPESESTRLVMAQTVVTAPAKVLSGASDVALGERRFAVVIEMNERAKEMRTLSFEVGLRALDAVVRSQGSQQVLAGFVEVSSQMRTWAAELHRQLEVINALSQEAVEQVSSLVRRRRLLTLMESASTAQTAHAHLVDLVEQTRTNIARAEGALALLWRTVDTAVDEVAQHGMMACILSRSARIEASYGRDDQREALSQVAAEFAQSADDLVRINAQLRTRLRS